jgi:uncharacterized protein (DUF1778 family)
MPNQATRSARLAARIAPDALALLKRAAEIQGRSVSDFMVAAAQDVAYRTIESVDVIKLSIESQHIFAEAILNPPKPSEGLKRAFERHRELIGEVR